MIDSRAVMKDLVVIDTSVIAHSIEELITRSGVLSDRNPTLSGMVDAEMFEESEKIITAITSAQLGYCQSGLWGGCLGLDNPIVVWVYDTKDIHGNYWRHPYLQERGITYKNRRKVKSATFSIIMQTIKANIERQKWYSLGVTEYEADDIAAAIVKRNRQTGSPCYVSLLTVDSDWCGLIGSDCRWLSSNSLWVPRIRESIETLNVWATRRWKITLSSPSDLWQFKADDGDASDSLPAGSPIEVIDLFNPPNRFNLLNKQKFLSQVDSILTNGEYKAVDGAKCRQYLRRKGIQVVVKEFSSEA